MANRSKKTAEAAPADAQRVSPDNQEQGEPREIRYVVVREGHRVSPTEYSDPNDPKAQEELSFWTRVENRHSWGAPVKIVQYDNKLHRVFDVYGPR